MRALQRLSSRFDIGGFAGSTELTQGLRFAGEVARQIGAGRAELFFLERDHVRVAPLRLVWLAPLVVDLAKSRIRNRVSVVVGAVHRFIDFDDMEVRGFR